MLKTRQVLKIQYINRKIPRVTTHHTHREREREREREYVCTRLGHRLLQECLRSRRQPYIGLLGLSGLLGLLGLIGLPGPPKEKALTTISDQITLIILITLIALIALIYIPKERELTTLRQLLVCSGQIARILVAGKCYSITHSDQVHLYIYIYIYMYELS